MAEAPTLEEPQNAAFSLKRDKLGGQKPGIQVLAEMHARQYITKQDKQLDYTLSSRNFSRAVQSSHGKRSAIPHRNICKSNYSSTALPSSYTHT